MPYNFWPYTNFHDLNLDYLLEKTRDIDDQVTAANNYAKAAHDAAEGAVVSAYQAQAAKDEAETAAQSARNAAEEAKDYAENIADPVGGIVADWIAENLSQETGYVIDASLTVEGAAADAKATGLAISDVRETLDAVEEFVGTDVFAKTVDSERSNYATATIDYSANAGDVLAVNLSGSAFTGDTAFFYVHYVGAAGMTSLGSGPIGQDVNYTLTDAIDQVRAYSAQGGSGKIRFVITKVTDTPYGLNKDILDLQDAVDDITDLINPPTVMRGAVAVSGTAMTINVPFTADAGDMIDVLPEGSCFTIDTVLIYLRYAGDSGNTAYGAVPIGQTTRIALERGVTNVYLFQQSQYITDGSATLKVKFPGVADYINENSEAIVTLGDFVNTIKGQKINFLGDSITYGSTADHPFTYYLTNIYGCICRNYGIAGSSLQYSENRNPMCVRYANMDDDADIVVVMGGTNDYWNNLPLGQFGDTTYNTFYGALEVLISGMIAKYPDKLFYMVTPPHGDNGDNFTGETKSNAGSMQDIADAVKTVCAKYSVPVLDLFNASNFYPSIAENYNAYYSDGVHLNTNGQKQLAQIHATYLLSHYRGKIE